MPPSEWEQPTVTRLLHRLRERREGDAKPYHIITVHDSRNKVQVCNLDIVVDKFINLPL